MEGDRARGRCPPRSRRGARPHRGIGRRQVHDRNREHGIHPGRVPHRGWHHRVRRSGAHQGLHRGSAKAPRGPDLLRRPERRRVVQPRPPAHQSVRGSPGRARGHAVRPGRVGGEGSLPQARPSRSRQHRLPISPPGFRGTAPAGDGRDGDGVQAGLDSSSTSPPPRST